MSGVRITLLCEDSQTDAFVRRFLRRRNFGARDVRTLPLPKGRQSGEQWVRQRYPAELRAIRGRQDAYLIVVTDADDRSTNERRAQLGAACAEQGVPVRTGEDPVLVVVPRRNIETWLAYLDAGEPVDEEVKYPRLKRERDCDRHFSGIFRHDPVTEDGGCFHTKTGPRNRRERTNANDPGGPALPARSPAHPLMNPRI